MDLSSFLLILPCFAVFDPRPLFTLYSLSISTSPLFPFQSLPPFSSALIGEPPAIISHPVHPPPLLLSPPLSILSSPPLPPFLLLSICLVLPMSPHVPSSNPSPTHILLSFSPPCTPRILLSSSLSCLLFFNVPLALLRSQTIF